MGRKRLELVKPDGNIVGAKLNKETDKRLEILAIQLDVHKSDLVEAAVRLLLEVLGDPSVVNVERIRDGELRAFLGRLLGRREKAAAVNVVA